MANIDKIYNCDCLEGMKDIVDKSVDAIICDLPYGTTRNSWDKVIPFDVLWEQYNRVIKDNGAIVLFSQQPFTSALVMSNPSMFRYEWIWDKHKATGFLNANKMPLKVHENICVFYKKSPTYNPQYTKGRAYFRRYAGNSSNYNSYSQEGGTDNKGTRNPIDIISFIAEMKPIHPTQKPIDLIRYLIKTYTNEGELVLDNCMGSGTTAIACIKEKRHFIGYELDKRYYDIACNRIKLEQAQFSLF